MVARWAQRVPRLSARRRPASAWRPTYRRAPGAPAPSSLTPSASPFVLAASRDGTFNYDLDIQVDDLPPASSTRRVHHVRGVDGDAQTRHVSTISARSRTARPSRAGRLEQVHGVRDRGSRRQSARSGAGPSCSSDGRPVRSCNRLPGIRSTTPVRHPSESVVSPIARRAAFGVVISLLAAARGLAAQRPDSSARPGAAGTRDSAPAIDVRYGRHAGHGGTPVDSTEAPSGRMIVPMMQDPNDSGARGRPSLGRH